MVKALEKPRPLPVLPPLTELDNSETAKRNIEEWSEAIAEQKRFNDELFERGLKRMKLCADLNRALGRSLNSHFSWCLTPIGMTTGRLKVGLLFPRFPR